MDTRLVVAVVVGAAAGYWLSKSVVKTSHVIVGTGVGGGLGYFLGKKL